MKQALLTLAAIALVCAAYLALAAVLSALGCE